MRWLSRGIVSARRTRMIWSQKGVHPERWKGSPGAAPPELRVNRIGPVAGAEWPEVRDEVRTMNGRFGALQLPRWPISPAPFQRSNREARRREAEGFWTNWGSPAGAESAEERPARTPRPPLLRLNRIGELPRAARSAAGDEAQAMNGRGLNGGAHELVCLPVCLLFPATESSRAEEVAVHPNPRQSHATMDRGPCRPGARSIIQLQA